MKRGSGVGLPVSLPVGSSRPRSCLPETTVTSRQRHNLALDARQLFPPPAQPRAQHAVCGSPAASGAETGEGGGNGAAGSQGACEKGLSKGGGVVGSGPGSAPFSQPCLPVKDTGPTRILPYLFLGSYQDSLNERELCSLGINFVLNVSRGTIKPNCVSEDCFMRIPVDDNYDAHITPYFQQAFQFIDRAKNSGGCVLVHCMAGISRSATVAIAYFMREHNCTHEEAMRFVKERRPSIAPNFNFLGQLLELEKSLKSERMQRYHQTHGSSSSLRTASESHIVGWTGSSSNSSTSSAHDTSSVSEEMLAAATSGRSMSLGMDEPKAPKRSRTDTGSTITTTTPSSTAPAKARPTGLNLTLMPPSTPSLPQINQSSKTSKDLDIEALVQSSLHVKTPEAIQREGLLLGAASTELTLHSPVCETGSSGSQPGTPGSSNKSSTHVGSPMDDDSVFKMPLPLLHSPLSDNEPPLFSSFSTTNKTPPKTLAPSTSKTWSPQASRKTVKLGSSFTTSLGAISKPHASKPRRKHPTTLEPHSDIHALVSSESRLFQAFYSKPLSPVEDCSPENAAGSSAGKTPEAFSQTSHLDPNTGVLSDSSSTTNSSGTGQKTDAADTKSSSIVRTKPLTRNSKSFPKTKLLLSEKLKVMIQRQSYRPQKMSENGSVSEGNIKRNDEKSRVYEVSPVPPRISRPRPSSFCLPAEYLDHWEELLAAARLSSRSMSCNMLEVRSRPFAGTEFATSSSSSYESLSRPSSLEAVEVGS
ncbi:uncharacterized protein LOC142340591 isoform X2 [Convolutriloba macropyga]|uniref:uncharacterized protein LOC142340591 isoform X2 n=1 Tax=Convolutriloba macropyga TaxID=536237 RepID=UPI003F51E8C0